MYERILRRPEVEHLTGQSRSSIYQKIAEGTFPEPVKLGPRAVGWPESAIQQWIEDRIQGGEK